MTGINLSPETVDRVEERSCYNVLAVGNAESFFLPPGAADPPPAPNAPAMMTSRSRWSVPTSMEAEAEMETSNMEEEE